MASTTVLQRQENIYSDDRSISNIQTIEDTQLSTTDITGFTKLIGNRLIKEESGLYFDKPYERNEYKVNVLHYRENANDSNYTYESTVPVTRKYETVFNPSTKSYTGFETTASRVYTVPAKDTDFRYDYIRKRFTMTAYHKKGNIGNTSYPTSWATESGVYKYEQSYKFNTKTAPTGFSSASAVSGSMPNGNSSVNLNYPRNKYWLYTSKSVGISSITDSQQLYYEQTCNLSGTASGFRIEDPVSNHNANDGVYTTRELVGTCTSFGGDTTYLSSISNSTSNDKSNLTGVYKERNPKMTASYKQPAKNTSITFNGQELVVGDVQPDPPIPYTTETPVGDMTFSLSAKDGDVNSAATVDWASLSSAVNKGTLSYSMTYNSKENDDSHDSVHFRVKVTTDGSDWDLTHVEKTWKWHTTETTSGSWNISGSLSRVGLSAGGAKHKANATATIKITGASKVTVNHYWTNTYRHV